MYGNVQYWHTVLNKREWPKGPTTLKEFFFEVDVSNFSCVQFRLGEGYNGVVQILECIMQSNKNMENSYDA